MKAHDASMFSDLCDDKLFEKFTNSKKYPRKVHRDDIVNAAATVILLFIHRMVFLDITEEIHSRL